MGTTLGAKRNGTVEIATDNLGRHRDTVAVSALAQSYEAIIGLLGEQPTRDGLLATPRRAARAMQYLTQGYRQDALAILNSAVFDEEYSEMIVVKGIELYSLCEHHLLPFFGKAHVAYIPNGKLVGLSKIPRVVDVFARRLQVQERLTVQIRDAVQEALKPRGVAVVIEAQHLCMIMRGVEKQHSATTTSAMCGDFLDNASTRAEFMRLIRHD